MMQHHIEDNQIAAYLLLSGSGGVSEDKLYAFSTAVADGLPGAFQHVAGIVPGGQIAEFSRQPGEQLAFSRAYFHDAGMLLKSEAFDHAEQRAMVIRVLDDQALLLAKLLRIPVEEIQRQL